MRKLFVLLLLVLVFSNFAAPRALLELEPARGEDPSDYRVVRDIPKSIARTSSKDISSYNWEIKYENADWYYYCPRPPEDTMAVRFVSPVKCSLVAFTYCSGSAAGIGDPLNVFVSDVNPAVDYSTYPGSDEADTLTPRSWGTLLWTGVRVCPDYGDWDTVNFTPMFIDTMTKSFFCGWNPTVTDQGLLAERNYYNGDPLTAHSYRYRDSQNRYYCYYITSEVWKLTLGIRAYIIALDNLPPSVSIEQLPWSYDTGDRPVYVAGGDFGPDSSGVVLVELYHRVNGGSWSMQSSNTPVSGTIVDGIWGFDIPGVSVGDTVDYYAIGKDWIDAADTTGVHSYVIIAGTPGNFLFVNNDYTESGVLPDFYEDIVDVWDFSAYSGPPDSAVFAFHSTGNDTQMTVVWRDWGAYAIGLGANYGAGVYHTDSAWIKLLLEAGGHFWLSDQDLGYGVGICPGYGRQDVPAGSWVQQYLGIQGMWDDDTIIGGSDLVLYGDPGDAVIGDLLSGVGYQAFGQIYISPYTPITGNFDYVWSGQFDSLQPGAVTNLFDAGGRILSFRYEPPAGGMVYMDFWPFDYICNPADSTEIDVVAVDTLVEDVLLWFGVKGSGISDEPIKPEKLVELLPVGIITGEAMIKFSLPERMAVSLSIYDNTGRLVKNLVNGEVDGGLLTYRWNADVAGVYFYRLRAGDRTLTEKMVVIR